MRGLLAAGADKDRASNDGYSPLTWARSCGGSGDTTPAVFVEYIFGWNGLGKQIVEALNQLDLPVVMGAVLVIGFTFVIINIMVDVIYAQLDPRVKV